MAVNDRFHTLLARIQPTDAEREKYESHRRTISRRLAEAFPETRVQVVGSHSRETAIHGASDLDLMVYFPADLARWGGKLKGSDTVLANVRSELQNRYHATGVRKDQQAVVVDFGQGSFNVDVVPAVWVGMTEKGVLGKRRPIYKIADGRGDWLDTSPQAHNTFIDLENRASGGRLRGTAQLVKFWRECRSAVALTSFYVELVLATEQICRRPNGYAQHLVDVFASLASRQCRALRDPLHLSGLIPAAGTTAQVEATSEAINLSLTLAREARDAETNRDLSRAYQLWKRVFNGNFPSG
jgi:hypothetical protein